MSAIGQGKEKITVRLSAFDYHGIQEPEPWAAWIAAKLREHGIPCIGGDYYHLERGTLQRFDDPKEWGGTIYEWTPDNPVIDTEVPK